MSSVTGPGLGAPRGRVAAREGADGKGPGLARAPAEGPLFLQAERHVEDTTPFRRERSVCERRARGLCPREKRGSRSKPICTDQRTTTEGMKEEQQSQHFLSA